VTRSWVDSCARIFHGSRRVPMDRDIVSRVLREHHIVVAVSAWIPDGVAREILDPAGVRRKARAA
jgi:hypothetical protein